MSRIGRQPIPVPAGVTVSIEPEVVRVNGPKGELFERVNRDMKVEQVDDQIVESAQKTFTVMHDWLCETP